MKKAPAFHTGRREPAATGLLIVAAMLASPVRAVGADFVVNSTLDTVDAAPGDGACASAGGACSLRAAVQEANALPGADVIVLRSGHYVLSLAGREEDHAAAGDLDIRSDIRIVGEGRATTVVDADGIDRVFHTAAAGVHLQLSALTLQNGVGGILAGGPEGARVTLESIIVRWCIEGIVAVHATLNLVDADIHENVRDGISIADTSMNSTVTLARATISHNAGAGIRVTGHVNGVPRLTVSDTTIAQNVDSGVYLAVARATMTRATISGNTGATGAGIQLRAGAKFQTELTLTNSTVQGNVGDSDGGGLLITGPSARATVSGTTISGNSAARGGAIAIVDGATLTLANTTLSGNSAKTSSGGALFGEARNTSPPRITLLNATISANASATAAALTLRYVDPLDPPLLWVGNTIIAGNTGAAPSNCDTAGPIFNLGHNLEFPGTTCGFGSENSLHADPNLLPLADNGGTTKTHRLGASSPARDAGDDATCAADPVGGIDQRGASRSTTGAHCDIGAYETATLPFQDDPLVAGMSIRAVHITELRQAIDDLRARFSLPDVAWTDPTLHGVWVRARHIEQMRTALLEALDAAGLPHPSFSDPTLVPGVTPVRARHIAELRSAVLSVD